MLMLRKMRRTMIAFIFLLWRGYVEAGIHEQRLIEAGGSYKPVLRIRFRILT
jgi:hypothetical protein